MIEGGLSDVKIPIPLQYQKTKYHLFVIQFPDKQYKFFKWIIYTKKGKVDYGFDSDENAANLLAETGATKYRRIYTNHFGL